MDQRWNLNIHYHRVFLDAIPHDAQTAIDVGCGDGLLSKDLRAAGLNVVGIDTHAPSIDRARGSERQATFICGDVLHTELGKVDFVASNAMLHHIDATAGLRRFRQLVNPGGVVAVVGFANPDGISDHLRAVGGSLLKRAQIVRGQYWEHNAPKHWPPPMTIAEMLSLAKAELPGVKAKRLLSNRYSLIWTAPTS